MTNPAGSEGVPRCNGCMPKTYPNWGCHIPTEDDPPHNPQHTACWVVWHTNTRLQLFVCFVSTHVPDRAYGQTLQVSAQSLSRIKASILAQLPPHVGKDNMHMCIWRTLSTLCKLLVAYRKGRPPGHRRSVSYSTWPGRQAVWQTLGQRSHQALQG